MALDGIGLIAPQVSEKHAQNSDTKIGRLDVIRNFAEASSLVLGTGKRRDKARSTRYCVWTQCRPGRLSASFCGETGAFLDFLCDHVPLTPEKPLSRLAAMVRRMQPRGLVSDSGHDRPSRKLLRCSLSNSMDAGSCVTARGRGADPVKSMANFNVEWQAQFLSTAFTGVVHTASVKISANGQHSRMESRMIRRLWRWPG